MDYLQSRTSWNIHREQKNCVLLTIALFLLFLFFYDVSCSSCTSQNKQNYLVGVDCKVSTDFEIKRLMCNSSWHLHFFRHHQTKMCVKHVIWTNKTGIIAKNKSKKVSWAWQIVKNCFLHALRKPERLPVIIKNGSTSTMLRCAPSSFSPNFSPPLNHFFSWNKDLISLENSTFCLR